MSDKNESTPSSAQPAPSERKGSSEASGVVQIDQEFNHFDRDGDGSIDFAEFSELVTRLGLGRGKTITRGMFDAIDTDTSGRITADEFSAWWSKGE